MKRFLAGLALFLASIIPIQSQVLYGPNLVNSSQAGVVLGPTTFPAQADTLIMTATAVNNGGVPSNVYFQTAPTQNGPWSNCASATALGATASTETVTLSCIPQGALYYRVYVQGGPPQLLNTFPFSLSSPRGVIYSDGQFWISDSGNNRLLNYNPITNVTSLVTLTGFTLSNPGQLGEVNGTDIFIADTGNSRVLDYNISAGTTSALTLGSPGGTAPNAIDGVCGDDISGKVYIADTNNNRLLTYNAGTVSVTAIGVTVNSPHGCQVDDVTGNLYFTDSGDNLAYRWTGSGAASMVPTTPQTLAGPLGIGYFDNSGEDVELIGDTLHSRIIQSIAGAGGVLTYFNAPGFPQLVNPNQIFVPNISFAPLSIANTGANNIVIVTFPNNGGSLSIGIVGINSLVSSSSGNGVIGTWNASTYYALNRVVAYMGTFYQSLIASNQGNVPNSSPSDWTTSISGGNSLPPASAALQVPVSTGSGTKYVSQGNYPLLNTGIHVVGVGSDTTIQTTINNAGVGGYVYIPAGTYSSPGLGVLTGQDIECASGTISGGGTTINITGANWALFNPLADLTTGSPATNSVQGLKVHNCNFNISANSAVLGGVRLKGISWSQFYNVSVITNGTVNGPNPAGVVTGGTYTSGITATGTTGQTCLLTAFNNGSSATAFVYLTGTNTVATGIVLHMTSLGTGATSAPTSATAGNGTATCSGAVTISTQLAGVSAITLDGGNLGFNGGDFFDEIYSFNNTDQGYPNTALLGVYVTNGSNDDKFYGGSVNTTGTSLLIDGGDNTQFYGLAGEDWVVNCIHLTANGGQSSTGDQIHGFRCESAGTNGNVSTQVDSNAKGNVIGALQTCGNTATCFFGVDDTNGQNYWEHTVIGNFAGRVVTDIFGTANFLETVAINKVPVGYAIDGTNEAGGIDVHGDIQGDRNIILGTFGGPGPLSKSTVIRSQATVPGEVVNVPDCPSGTCSFALSGASNVVVAPTGTATSSSNFNSFFLQWEASYWNSSSIATIDQFNCLNEIGSGTLPTAILLCSHVGAVNPGGVVWDNTNWQWGNTAAATSGANVPAPNFTLIGNYWNGSATAQDIWRITPTLGTGANPASSLVITHSGSTGTSIGLESQNFTTSVGFYYGTFHGTNASAGVATLTSGTVTVSTTAIGALAVSGGAGNAVQLTFQTCVSCGFLALGTVTPGSSFVINSYSAPGVLNATDSSSTVYWQIQKLY